MITVKPLASSKKGEVGVWISRESLDQIIMQLCMHMNPLNVGFNFNDAENEKQRGDPCVSFNI